MKEEDKEKLKELRQKRDKEVYANKLTDELALPASAIDFDSSIEDFDSLTLPNKYKWYKRLTNEDYVYENNYVTLSKSGTVHFIRSWTVHHDFTDSWIGPDEPYDEEKEGTVCGGDGPWTFDKRRVENVQLTKDKICKSCLKAKRRRIAALNTVKKAGGEL